jgi:hypothetical protein
MVKLHRSLIEEAGSGPRAMLDTPFGFQANADDLTAKIQEYFADSVGSPIEVARWRRRDEPSAVRERALALLQRAAFVFAGPGSPTYALKQWEATAVPETFLDVLGRAGTVVLGSAAAVTTGAWSVPVYEIYKVGEEPHWVEGLDILGSLTGIRAAVIPHFDNKEGGRHDTRFCYLGEDRLEVMERLLPEGVGVLGVDEHTAIIIDSDADVVTVHGAGGLTLRSGGRTHVVPSGGSLPLGELGGLLSGVSPASAAPVVAAAPRTPDGADETGDATPSLRSVATELRARFDDALAGGDADGAMEAALALEEAIQLWSADTLQGADLSMARQALRSMIVALATAAQEGLRDPRALLDPVVQVVLEARARARSAGDYATGDALRDGLMAAGIEVRDGATGSLWSFHTAD